MAARDRRNTRGGVVIRKEEVVHGGHHGGAWKVAYADFVTAMMAFFLLMWLLNATTETQRRGLADYFAPLNVLGRNVSGSGKPLGGKTPYEDGSLVSSQGAQAAIIGKSLPQPDSGASGPAGAQETGAAPASGSVDQAEHDGSAGDVEDAAGNASRATDQDGPQSPGGGVPRRR
jgi:chemotaxis protein MotB